MFQRCKLPSRVHTGMRYQRSRESLVSCSSLAQRRPGWSPYCCPLLRLHSAFVASFFAAEVLRELGIALILVAVATVSIEAARVRAFTADLFAIVDAKLAEIERTAADAIMRGPFPKSYYEHVKRLMLLKPFLRSDWRINLVFNHKQDCFEMLFEQHFRITNLASIAQTYLVVHHESPDLGGDFKGFARIRYARARKDNAPDW
jgi:hypothetical protein